MTRLKCELLELMDSSEDSVLICDLGLTTRVSDKNFQYLGVLKEDRDDSIMIY